MVWNTASIMKKETLPTTLREAFIQFSNEDLCVQFVAVMRWPDGDPVCPHCNQTGTGYLKTQRRWKCKNRDCRKQFSVKVGTIFEDSPIPLSKWLTVVWMVTNCKNGISSYEVARDIGVTQKSAWFMEHRVRTAMESGSFQKRLFSGKVEADETFIGGLARNMHKSRRLKTVKGPGGIASGKTAVMGLLERHGKKGKSQIRAAVVKNTRRKTLQGEIRVNVEKGSEVFTDGLLSYEGLGPDFFHDFVDHAETYVKGQVHTNGVENFWTLLKRTIKGTYVSVEPFHLFRYLNEQTFRFNERDKDDLGRFLTVMSGIAGKRLTYANLIGKDGLPEPAQP